MSAVTFLSCSLLQFKYLQLVWKNIIYHCPGFQHSNSMIFSINMPSTSYVLPFLFKFNVNLNLITYVRTLKIFLIFQLDLSEKIILEYLHSKSLISVKISMKCSHQIRMLKLGFRSCEFCKLKSGLKEIP